MKIGDKVKVLKGLMRDRIGVIEKVINYRGKKLYMVAEKVLANNDWGWDKYYTTVLENEIEPVI